MSNNWLTVPVYRSSPGSKWHAADPIIGSLTACGLPLPRGGDRDSKSVAANKLCGACFP